MGQEQSTEQDPAVGNSADTNNADEIESDTPDEPDLQAISAYRVMKVFQGSPSSRSGLMPFEDFIVSVNGVVVNSDNTVLARTLQANEGVSVALIIYNVVDATQRQVALCPVKWNGPGLLGAAVRYEPIAGAIDHVHRVLEVLPGSPAAEAGLVPNTDYIVGTPAEVFRSESEFYKLVCVLLTLPFLFIYSSKNIFSSFKSSSFLHLWF